MKSKKTFSCNCYAKLLENTYCANFLVEYEYSMLNEWNPKNIFCAFLRSWWWIKGTACLLRQRLLYWGQVSGRALLYPDVNITPACTCWMPLRYPRTLPDPKLPPEPINSRRPRYISTPWCYLEFVFQVFKFCSLCLMYNRPISQVFWVRDFDLVLL